MGKIAEQAIPCRIRVLRDVCDIFPRYRPTVGSVHDAVYNKPRMNLAEFCLIDVLDKKIILRRGEFEIIERK